jgi:hypothetical protein
VVKRSTAATSGRQNELGERLQLSIQPIDGSLKLFEVLPVNVKRNLGHWR